MKKLSLFLACLGVYWCSNLHAAASKENTMMTAESLDTVKEPACMTNQEFAAELQAEAVAKGYTKIDENHPYLTTVVKADGTKVYEIKPNARASWSTSEDGRKILLVTDPATGRKDNECFDCSGGCFSWTLSCSPMGGPGSWWHCPGCQYCSGYTYPCATEWK